MRNLKLFTLLALAVLCAVMPLTSFAADLRLPHIFGDNMVLQAGASTPVWGWATPGGKVYVSIGKQTVSAVADTQGKWKLALKNLKHCAEPTTVTVKGDTTIALQNVLVGDCWLGSGQSNMEMAMADITNAKEEIAAANNPTIRLFTVVRNEKGIRADDCVGQWVVCTPETVNRFSSVLYLFGREISQKTNTPLGLIHSSVGGTRIELWTAPEGFDLIPEFAHYNASIKATDEAFAKMLPEKLAAVEQWTKDTRKALAEGKPIPVSPEWPNRPGVDGGAAVLYNGMIHPLVPFAIRGFVWYQGEWNNPENEIYVKRMEALIGGWRKIWGQGDLPFYYVQLARMPEKEHLPWNPGYLTPVREAQLKALSIPNTGMSCIIDLEGSSGWHPGNKQDPSHRLAVWALKNEYGMKNLVVSGPLYKSIRVDGNKIIISFDYTGSGLMVGFKNGLEPVKQLADGALGSFGIAGEDKQWFPAKAVISGKEVIVSSPDVAKPIAVRYGYTNDPDNCNLYNIDGLPASPFRTDNW